MSSNDVSQGFERRFLSLLKRNIFSNLLAIYDWIPTVKYMTIKGCYNLYTNGVMRGVDPFVTKYERIAVDQNQILIRILESVRLCVYGSIHIFTKSFARYITKVLN